MSIPADLPSANSEKASPTASQNHIGEDVDEAKKSRNYTELLAYIKSLIESGDVCRVTEWPDVDHPELFRTVVDQTSDAKEKSWRE